MVDKSKQVKIKVPKIVEKNIFVDKGERNKIPKFFFTFRATTANCGL